MNDPAFIIGVGFAVAAVLYATGVLTIGKSGGNVSPAGPVAEAFEELRLAYKSEAKTAIDADQFEKCRSCLAECEKLKPPTPPEPADEKAV